MYRITLNKRDFTRLLLAMMHFEFLDQIKPSEDSDEDKDIVELNFKDLLKYSNAFLLEWVSQNNLKVPYGLENKKKDVYDCLNVFVDDDSIEELRNNIKELINY